MQARAHNGRRRKTFALRKLRAEKKLHKMGDRLLKINLLHLKHLVQPTFCSSQQETAPASFLHTKPYSLVYRMTRFQNKHRVLQETPEGSLQHDESLNNPGSALVAGDIAVCQTL
ncbi:hypothetical protein [Paenibacillus tyrfis]|uniref:hypothetical protein n=1 Tax=Paenibacillus tyrfis TaxID=1501230 RepID=UPI0020A19C62|nr:hypothetical protein [Paenibacillus tyrfis]MCP1306069.1 hypothetical protein [Paenibacillus tyrfis]